MENKNQFVNIFAAIIALFLQACVNSGSISDSLSVEKGVDPETLVTMGDGLLTSLSLESGITLEFVDVGDNYVGIVERTPPGVPSVLAPTISKWAASPLEIYLALKSTNSDVPKALMIDHKLQMVRAGKGDAAPRPLNIQLSFPGTAAPPVVDSFACDSFGTNWANYWNNTFDGVTDSRASASVHQRTVSLTFYPGAPVYRGTGRNQITYLGACNADDGDVDDVDDVDDVGVGIEVHRWGAVVEVQQAPQPPTVTYQWLLVSGTNKFMGFQEKYLFYSRHPSARYRARINSPEEGEVHEHYGIGAAWTKSLPLSIGF